MPRPYGPVPPLRTPSDRRYPLTRPTSGKWVPPPGSFGMGPSSRSNVSLNSANRPPRSNYERTLPPPSAIGGDASSVYSDYVPPRRQWTAPPTSQSLNEEYPDTNRYRPERPKIDTYNLDRNDRTIHNYYVAAR